MKMVGVASGLSATGKIAFATTFACFASRRIYDQFFISSGFAKLKVNLTGSDPGITAQWNGGTHMTFEDAGVMRNTPEFLIYGPSDPVSLRHNVKPSVGVPNATHLRQQRRGSNQLYDEDETFSFGKGEVPKDGRDVTIVALGFLLIPAALKAADFLGKQGIDAAVIDMHSIKRFDEDLFTTYAKRTGSVVVCEYHQSDTGLGAAICHIPPPLQKPYDDGWDNLYRRQVWGGGRRPLPPGALRSHRRVIRSIRARSPCRSKLTHIIRCDAVTGMLSGKLERGRA